MTLVLLIADKFTIAFHLKTAEEMTKKLAYINFNFTFEDMSIVV